MKIVVLFGIILVWLEAVTMQEFASANNFFTASVYKEISKKEEKNVLVSPLSAEIVLALTESGAKNETAEEIRNCLHLPNSEEKIQTVFKNVFGALKGGHHYTLHMANIIYVNKSFSIQPHFKKIANEVFGTDVENVDFSRNIEAANAINKWVENHTENKIHNLVTPGGLDKTTLLLVNALYFKGSWKHPFSKHSTEKKNFHKTAKNVIQVDTMRSTGKTFGYYENSQLKAKFLDLRFKGEGVALVIALPNEIEGLAALESHAEKVFGPHKFASETVEVALPKFKIETRTDFKDVLKKLGVNKTFSAEEADLSGIAGEKGDLVVNEVLQKAFIEVDEEGVEAAAATFVASPRMLMLRPPPARKFIADHPFMFYITVKNVIVFGGRVTEPSY